MEKVGFNSANDIRTIRNVRQESQEERAFVDWVKEHGKSGATYATPEGHLVSVDELRAGDINLKQPSRVVKSPSRTITDPNINVKQPSRVVQSPSRVVDVPSRVVREMEGIHLPRQITQDTVNLGTNDIRNIKFESQEERAFIDWVKEHGKSGATYSTPEGHLVAVDELRAGDINLKRIKPKMTSGNKLTKADKVSSEISRFIDELCSKGKVGTFFTEINGKLKPVEITEGAIQRWKGMHNVLNVLKHIR